jgi:hypothetical protein
MNIYEYVYDIETGRLHLGEHSPGDAGGPRGPSWR